MRKRNNMTYSYCKCPECSRLFKIPRIEGQQREKEHKKDVWCAFCKKEVTQIEYRKEWEFEEYQNYNEKLVPVRY